MMREITIPTALRDKALKEIKDTAARQHPNLSDEQLRQYAESMLDSQWHSAVTAFETGAKPALSALLATAVIPRVSNPHWTDEDRAHLQRVAANTSAHGAESVRDMYTQGLTITLMNAGMIKATASEIVSECFFKAAE